MRCTFSSVDYAKSEARLYADIYDISLTEAKSQFSILCGYRNWKELVASPRGEDTYWNRATVLSSIQDHYFSVLSLYSPLAYNVRVAMIANSYLPQDIRDFMVSLRYRIAYLDVAHLDADEHPSFTFIRDDNDIARRPIGQLFAGYFWYGVIQSKKYSDTRYSDVTPYRFTDMKTLNSVIHEFDFPAITQDAPYQGYDALMFQGGLYGVGRYNHEAPISSKLWNVETMYLLSNALIKTSVFIVFYHENDLKALQDETYCTRRKYEERTGCWENGAFTRFANYNRFRNPLIFEDREKFNDLLNDERPFCHFHHKKFLMAARCFMDMVNFSDGRFDENIAVISKDLFPNLSVSKDRETCSFIPISLPLLEKSVIFTGKGKNLNVVRDFMRCQNEYYIFSTLDSFYEAVSLGYIRLLYLTGHSIMVIEENTRMEETARSIREHLKDRILDPVPTTTTKEYR